MYKPYNVMYVKRLERAVGLLVFLLATLLPVLVYLLTTKLVEAPTGIFGVNPKLPVEVRIKELTQAKIDSQIRGFVKHTNPKLSYRQVMLISELEQKYARLYDVPLEIGLAITLTESGFRPEAVSPTLPTGLKQIAFSYWKTDCKLKSREQLKDIDTNIECGYKILAKHYRRTGDWKTVLRMYYGGTAKENQKYLLTVWKRAVKMRDITT